MLVDLLDLFPFPAAVFIQCQADLFAGGHRRVGIGITVAAGVVIVSCEDAHEQGACLCHSRTDVCVFRPGESEIPLGAEVDSLGVGL